MVREQQYPWTRYWLPWNGTPTPPATDYLPEMSDDWSRRYFGDFRTLSELADVPCLVLLGEPGIGKSTAVEDEAARLQSIAPVARIDLKAAPGEQRMLRRIFGAGPFQQLCAEGAPVTIFLDSFDEGRVAVPQLAGILAAELEARLAGRAETHKLRLRITCRSAEWPQHLSDALVDLFGPEHVEIRHMCQLRQSDVAAAAAVHGIDGEAFLREVNDRGAEALAVKPVTLGMLLSIRQGDGRLPSRQADLYRQGTLDLCSDPNRWRHAEEQTGRLSPAQRLAVARRIAALSVFCARPFIRRHDLPEAAEDGVLTLTEICAAPASEAIGGEQFAFTPRDVREVLGTGLFRGAGGDLVSWAHQTYAEFLAAEQVVTRGLTWPQIASLLHVPGERDGRVVPQLHEAAAWLASLSPQLGARLMDANPDVMLRSDVLAADDDDAKADLARRYLEAIERRQISDGSLGRNYPRLASPALAAVLRPYVVEKERHYSARFAAMDIAERCRCSDLAPDLLCLALDETDSKPMRRSALKALEPVVSMNERQAIRPLLAEADDELRGYAIRLLWPGVVSTGEMLPALTPPTRPNFIGFYNVFIREELPKRLPAKEIPVALAWMAAFVEAHPNPRAHGEHDGRLYELIHAFAAIFARALEAAAIDPSIANPLLDLTETLLRHSAWLYAGSGEPIKAVPRDDAVRRRLALGILARIRNRERAAIRLMHPLPLIQRGKDTGWLLGLLETETDPKRRQVLANMLVDAFDREQEADFTLVYDALDRIPELKQYFEAIVGFIPLDSELAEFRRKELAWSRRSEPKQEAPTPDQVATHTETQLTLTIGGHPAAWVRLIRLLARSQASALEGTHDSGMAALPGWQHLPPRLQDIAHQAALAYVEAGDPGLPDWWQEGNLFDWRAHAGYRALDHLLDADPSALERLGPAAWKKWAPAVIATSMNDEERLGRGAKLAQLCFRAVPDAYVGRLRERIATLLQHDGDSLHLPRLLKGLWSEEIAALAADTLARPELFPDRFHEVLGLLFEHDHPSAKAELDTALDGRVPDARRAIVIATAIRQGGATAWRHILPQIEPDPELLRAVIDRATDDDFLADMGLEDEEIADLYLLLDRILPKDRASSGWVSRDAPLIRDSIPRYLVNKSTESACRALERILAAGPEYEWVSHALIDCRENRLRCEWMAPKPDHLLGLFAGRDRRFVRSGSELLDVVMESLSRFEAELNGGKPPTRGFVWNTQPKNYRPKEENEISDVIAAHLKRDLVGRGVVVNREVELSPARGGAPGERTDIHVDAVLGGNPADVITTLIEVKGCWNDTVREALVTQLVARYLAGRKPRHGIYLVGWFHCPVWTEEDRRRDKTSRLLGENIEAVRDQFRTQANAQTAKGLDVRAFVLDARWPGDGEKSAS